MATHDYKPVATDPKLPVLVTEPGQYWRQYVFGCTASITVILSGFVMGWTSPVNMKLQDMEETPLPAIVTKDEEAMIGALLTIGAILGPFMGSFVAAKLGRKSSLLAISVPFFVGLTLIALAKSVMYLYVGRFMWGLSVGMTFSVLPMYLVEIATVDARGTLATFLELFVAVGFFSAYAIGPYISYHAIAYVGLVVTSSCASFFFLPESPRYHLMKGNTEKAAASLMVLRGKSRKGVDEELAELIEEVNTSMEKTAKVSDIFRGTNLKTLMLSSALLFCQQFCGITPMLFFATNIFDAAGADMDKYVSTIIVGAVQIFSSFTSSILVEKLGRKILLLVSSAGLTCGLVSLGLYFYLDEISHPIVPKLSLLPVSSLALYVIAYYIGAGPIIWTLVNEFQSIEVKSVSSPILTAFSWCLGFVVTRFFVPTAVALGWYTVFWVFAVVCVFTFFFTLFVVPETKGKTALEIQEMLAGRRFTSNKDSNIEDGTESVALKNSKNYA